VSYFLSSCYYGPLVVPPDCWRAFVYCSIMSRWIGLLFYFYSRYNLVLRYCSFLTSPQHPCSSNPATAIPQSQLASGLRCVFLFFQFLDLGYSTLVQIIFSLNSILAWVMKSDIAIRQIEKWSMDYIKMDCAEEKCYGVLAVSLHH
jgi:hypothetical protein